MQDERFMWAIRLSAAEKEQLKALANLDGVTMSAMVRLLIRRSYDRKIKP